MEADYCQILDQSLSGDRAIDERTFASAAILSERLERLKKLNKVFSGVKFSPVVRKLVEQKRSLAVSG